MNWLHEYRSRVTTVDEALRVVESGHRVYVGNGCGAPQPLVTALANRAAALRSVEIVHLMTLGEAPYAAPEMAGHFRHQAFFIGENVRSAVNEGRADFIPIFLSEIPRLFTDGSLPIDVAMIQVSPPDEHGFCSFGVSVDCTKPAAESARIVIAHVNPQMPRTLGDSFIHVSKLDAVVESDEPLPELPRSPISDVQRRIGQHVAALIEDGSTLQMGIGGIPDAVLSNLTEKRDLGVHTEMFSDGIVDLIEAGVITNERKTLHPGKVVSSFLLGSRVLYQFTDNNPIIELHPSHYTNDPFIIAQNERMVAINSAIEVDLTGQVCADSIGPRFYSGIGGQLDFIRGAARSKGGKPIIALPSTAKNGQASRLVPFLTPGAGVVTTRGDVHYVVTEYGTAFLHGKSIRQRARALIDIAHPDFRDSLEAFARERHYV
ncbi:MAG: acetyl-CoA hydrolase/transferase family protein [Candidatus Latescibacteria bacterium]|nr:acetyl-CoA hydrolase/transferase family protein [Candidatus Latescibacterota bacterium]